MKPKIIRTEVVNQGEHSLNLKLTGWCLKILDGLTNDEEKEFCDNLSNAIQAKLDKKFKAK